MTRVPILRRLAVLDEHTCDACRRLHGSTLAADDSTRMPPAQCENLDPTVGEEAPCRCTALPAAL